MSKKTVIYKITALVSLGLIVCILSLTLALEPKFKINGIKAMDIEVLNELTRTVTVFDNEDKPLTKTLNGNGNLFCPIDSLPRFVLDAFVSVEDKRFYSHKGLDYRRIASAAVKDVSSMSFKEGASTITQQLAKNTHLDGQKKLKRKLAEARIARQIERQFTKTQILELYLNSIYFGSNAYGIEEASQVYFNCAAVDLTLDQAALLAGVINSPSTYSPKSKKDNALRRRNVILNLMLNQNLISKEQYDLAYATDTEIVANSNPNLFRAYIKEAIQEAQHLAKNAMGEIEVYTYLDQSLQNKTQASIAKAGDTLCSAIVIDNQSGGISSYCTNSFNYLADLKRQPGSTIKPVLVYAPAIEYGQYSLSSPILDERTSFGTYEPKNYLDKYYGWVSFKDALSRSLNVPSVKIMQDVGIENCKDFAKNLGIEFNKKDQNLALSLGGMTEGIDLRQNCGAFTAFARGGNYIKPSFVRKLLDTQGNLIFSRGRFLGKKVMGEDTAYLVTDALMGAVKSGTARRLNNLDFEVAAKTGTVGTSNGNTDAYCISYTTKNTVGVWMGSQNSLSPMNNKIRGGSLPLTINRELLVGAHKDRPKDFKRPPSIVELCIDAKILNDNHKLVLAKDANKKQTEIFSNRFAKKLITQPNDTQTPLKTNAKKNIFSRAKEFINMSKISKKTINK